MQNMKERKLLKFKHELWTPGGLSRSKYNVFGHSEDVIHTRLQAGYSILQSVGLPKSLQRYKNLTGEEIRLIASKNVHLTREEIGLLCHLSVYALNKALGAD